MNQELIRIIDNIAKDKNIDRESIFQDLEAAMISGVKKHYGQPDSDIVVHIDRSNGSITAYKDDMLIDIKSLGRIPAQTAKQVMIQKIKADERGSIFAEYIQKKGEIIAGSLARFEGGNLIITLDTRVEGVLAKNELISGQSHHIGERIRAIITDVKEKPGQIQIKLSRSHPDFIRRLFEQEVPEVQEHIVEIRGLSRESGYRTKIAVDSSDDRVDPVGACVGVRGSRIKNIVDELGGEKIDIVRWDESSQILIANALKPADAKEIAICFELGRATVVVEEDQLSLAIGKHGQNVRLAARLTGWDIDILTPNEYNDEVDKLAASYANMEGFDESLIDNFLALGLLSVLDIEEVGETPLIEELGIDADFAKLIVDVAIEEAKAQAAEVANAKKAAEVNEETEESVVEDNSEEAIQEEVNEEE